MSEVVAPPTAEMNAPAPNTESVPSMEMDAVTVQSCKDDLVSLKKEIEADLENASGKTRKELEAIIDSLDLERLEAMSEDELLFLKKEVEELREQAMEKKDEKKGLMKMFSRFGFKKRGNKNSDIESKPSQSSIATKEKMEPAQSSMSVAEDEAPVIENQSSKLSLSSKTSVSSKKSVKSVASKKSIASKMSVASKVTSNRSATVAEDAASVESKESLERERSIASKKSVSEESKNLEAPISMSRTISKTTVTSNGEVELEAVGEEEKSVADPIEEETSSVPAVEEEPKPVAEEGAVDAEDQAEEQVNVESDDRVSVKPSKSMESQAKSVASKKSVMSEAKSVASKKSIMSKKSIASRTSRA